MSNLSRNYLIYYYFRVKLIRGIFLCLFSAVLIILISEKNIYGSLLQLEYSPPLGYLSKISYGPYPSTRFGVQNPDLPNQDTCFTNDSGVSIKWPNLFHAGTDWFKLNGNSAVSDPVTSIADGTVEWASIGAKYPGETVIIKHNDPGLGVIYSVYMHLYAVKVKNGDTVVQGEQLGQVITQTNVLADGTISDNSHLHWEVRTFADATQQTWFPQTCDSANAGEGYTKDDPVQDGYLDPDSIFNKDVFLPLVNRAPTPTITPTPIIRPTPIPTPTPTVTPTLTPTPTPICVANLNLVQNGDFEDPSRWSVWVADTPNLINAYVDVPDEYALVMGYENGVNQTVYQTIRVPPGVRTVDIKFQLYIKTLEVAPIDFDYLEVDVVGNTGVTGASVLHTPFPPFTNRSPLDQWTQQVFHVTDAAQLQAPIRLQFHATTNWAMATAFTIDNIQLITGCQ